MKNAVIVKSFRNGLTLYLDSDLDFGQLLEEVAGKFKESKEFFSDASVAVSFEGRELSFEEEDSLIETIRTNSQLNIRYEEESAGQFYRGTLRRGQILETESSIIVLGDVNPGSSVIAAGDIVALGSLRGNAYAGGNGRPGHYIAALEMAPQKIKIGDFKYIANEKSKWTFGTHGLYGLHGSDRNAGHAPKIQPQTAYVEKERIILKPITNELLNVQ